LPETVNPPLLRLAFFTPHKTSPLGVITATGSVIEQPETTIAPPKTSAIDRIREALRSHVDAFVRSDVSGAYGGQKRIAQHGG
jgi:hypothetical protein